MKPPKPTEGVARHCWGKRRRAAKKIEKGIWKAMDRLGILRKSHIKAGDCSWEEGIRKHGMPLICGWSEPSYGYDDWSEWPVINIAHDHCDAPAWKNYEYDAMQGRSPAPIAKSDRHALQLLREEIRDRKRRTQAPGQRGEG